MITDWLNHSEEKANKYVDNFNLIHICEKNEPDENLVNYLKKAILTSYRSIELYKFYLKDASEEKLRQYVKDYVIPSDENQIVKNVKQGDWGEILTSLIVTCFQDLEVPINKLKWKFNKNRSVFATDMIAHNKGSAIQEIFYYEIKTRLTPDKKEKINKKTESQYITIIAHNSLLKDERSPTEAIADFFMRHYEDKGDFDSAKKYKDIVLNPKNYNRKFELFFIIEKDNFIENIITELNDLPPQLKPLRVSIVFIENLKQLIENCWKDIENAAIDILKVS